jgi:hypothetical protein
MIKDALFKARLIQVEELLLTHAAKVVAQIGPTCVQRLSSQAKCDRKSTHDMKCACRKNLPAADSVVRTKTEPGSESCSTAEFRKICADLR